MKRLILYPVLLLFFGKLLLAQSQYGLRMDAYGSLWARDYSQAVLAFDKLIGQSSSPSAAFYCSRGEARFYLGDPSHSLTDFMESARMGNADAYLWQARCYALLGDMPKVIPSLENYLTKSDLPDPSRIKRDTLFRSLQGTEAWLNLWQKNGSNDALDAISEADYYARRANFAQAHQILEEHLGSGNKDALLYASNATIYRKESNIELALNEINHALSLQPEDPDLLHQKMEYLVLLGEPKEAFRIASRLLTQTPENFELRLDRTRLAIGISELSLAKEDIELMLKYSQTDEIVFLGGQVAYALGNYVDALRYYNQVLSKDSSKASYFKARGMTYYKTRTYKQAGYDLSMSLDLDPADPEVNYYKGLTENAMGDKSMACYYMARAMKMNYTPAIEFSTRNCEK